MNWLFGVVPNWTQISATLLNCNPKAVINSNQKNLNLVRYDMFTSKSDNTENSSAVICRSVLFIIMEEFVLPI